MTLRAIGMFFVAIAFYVAPFLWSYIASVSGFLVRAVDVAFIFVLLVALFWRRVVVQSLPIFFCFVALIFLTVLRAAIFSETEALISAIKITFYLSSALACTTFLASCTEGELRGAARWALIAVSPFYAFFSVSILWTFVDLEASRAISSPSQFVFRFWNSIFAVNVFGSVGLEEFRGVSFRNTGGIGFLVLSLFFFWIKGRPNLLFLTAFVLAALFFSRSVWVCQLVFISLLALRASGFSRFITFFLVAVVASVLMFSDYANEAVSDRIDSDVGRVEMITPAIEEMGKSFLIGGEKGAGLFEKNGITTDLHNVPLSFGLKSGLFGLLFASLIPAYFALEGFRRTIHLLFSGAPANENAAAITLCLILFLRPLISASHDVYFSVGEWLAFALLFAIKQREAVRRRSGRLLHSDPLNQNNPALDGLAGVTRPIP